MAEPLEEASRRAMLTLLRTDKEVREEVGRLILESAVMQELRALREDTNRRFEELRADMRSEFRLVRDQIAALGGRWGIQNEEAVRQFATEFIAREFGVKAGRWRRGDAEVDIVIHDGRHHLIEVTSSCDEKHLDRFLKTARAYERSTKKRVGRRVVVTGHATGRAWQLALREGVEILSG